MTDFVSKKQRQDVLQTLLEAQQLCLDLFDAIEAGQVLTAEQIRKLANLVGRLTAFHQAALAAYIMSDQAVQDVLEFARLPFKDRS